MKKNCDFSELPVGKVDRRKFIVGIGAGAAGLICQPIESIAQRIEGLQNEYADERSGRTDRFSRMFNLRPFAEARPQVQRALMEMGAPSGLMDAKDPLSEGPIRLITNPELSPHNRDSSTTTAGITFVGQFLDHDLTFDATSRLGIPTAPERSPNNRTPRLDLDSLYGGGPTVSPQLYDPSDRARFKVESGGMFEDLPRRSDGTAIIADPRNDENMVISGLQAAFLIFHNRVVDRLRKNGDDIRLTQQDHSRLRESEDGDLQRNVFSEARRLVMWHYQWMIVHEFLPAIIGAPLVNDILSRGRNFYTPRRGEQSMPVEFQAAAYRFGHSQVRPSYRANLAGDLGQPFFGFIFDAAGEGQIDPVDLRGGCRASRRFIGWQTFFNFGGAQSVNARPNKVVDTKISTPLFHLPLGAIANGDQPVALPQRNLLRHLTWSLPSGQSIAEVMRVPALGPSQFSELAPFGVGFERSTPLWYYILKEAEVMTSGARLAGVGARIVGEVILGLIQLDETSFLSQDPGWRPTLPSRTRGSFAMVDLLTFAGVDPASRKQ